jgi:hypothetical protein
MRSQSSSSAVSHRFTAGMRSGLPLLGCAIFVAACVGQIGDGVEGGIDSVGEKKSPQCAVLDPGTSPIRRMTRVEYDNTVRDLLGDDTRPAQGFVAEEESLGFNNQAKALNVTQLLAEQYLEAAEALASEAVKDLPGLTGCDDALADAACAEQFIVDFGTKAFRRPLGADEVERYRTLFDVWSGDGFETAIRMVVTALLQSPHFLYRVEFGMPDPVQGDVVELTQHEVASRLSYLLWNSMPDDELFAAASAGKLASREEISAQASRMLADPRAREAVQNFHTQWLGLGAMDAVVKDEQTYPSYDDSLRELWTAETEAFVSHVVFDGEGDVATLLSAPYTMVNAELADFYGMTGGPSGAAFEKVALDPEQRAGFLTHASVMAINAMTNQTSPVHRGQFVRERLLCQVLPPPPDDVDINPPAVDPTATTRERFAQHSEDPACAGCHQLMDPIGFGFENYDGIGLWRTKEGTLAVDASGEVVEAGDATGSFVGAVELAQQLADSDMVRECVTTQWFRFGFGRPEEEADACSIDTIYEAFEASGWDIQTLLLALTQTDAFLYRRAVVAEGGSQ